MCICRRRHGGRRTHSRRSSLQASWKRARQDLRDSEGDEYWRGVFLRRHPGIEAVPLDRSDEEAWERHVQTQLQMHEAH
eukprot:7610938-Heterocapsa_arctica.AAC.1